MAASSASYTPDVVRRANETTYYALAPLGIGAILGFSVAPSTLTSSAYGLILLGVLAVAAIACIMRVRLMLWKRRALRDRDLLNTAVAVQLMKTRGLSMEQANAFVQAAHFETLNAGLQYAFRGCVDDHQTTIYVRHNGDIDVVTEGVHA
ncbi:hypothetical protein GCM10025867_50160 (plasmid) [Frondihabitans sucicola]|uniref:Uncharacterized protein n=1 Tax=Frondihabitans sucicola TaxID=1268041 RepID=A0ABN6YA01_9MICO|nr:hypothetical protein [Frondihabitans sucicola]BDZ52775.1 hypothetical protein GCM10025867_50160 [Frondihabitans sucicola]